jgi:hypothetical protein
VCLQAGDVRRLQALGAARDFELNRLAIAQRFVTIPHNRGEVDENVLAGLALDESKALAGVKPLNCSLFFQLRFSFLFELFGAIPHRLQPKNRAASVDLQPLQRFQRFYKSNKRKDSIAGLRAPVETILSAVAAK